MRNQLRRRSTQHPLALCGSPALLAALDALAVPGVEAQAWTAVLRGVLDGVPAAVLPPAVATLAAGFSAMTARWSVGDEDGG